MRDASGNLDSDTGTAVVGAVEPPPGGGGTPDYAVVHYQRPAGDYDGWGFHFWGDIDQTVEWTSPVPLAGEDAYGPFAWVKLLPDAAKVGFILHKGDEKDPDADRVLQPVAEPGDLAQAGRPDGLHVTRRGAGLRRRSTTSGRTATTPAGACTCGATRSTRARATDVGDPEAADRHRRLRRLLEGPARRTPTQPVNFIVHKGDEKDTADDRSFLPDRVPEAWLQSGDTTIHPTRGSAEDFAVIHYHRPDGDYGDATVDELHRLLGPAHVGRAPRPGSRVDGADQARRHGPLRRVLQARPRRRRDRARLHPPPRRHQGSRPRPVPRPRQLGHEVWYLSGHTDADQMASTCCRSRPGPGTTPTCRARRRTG